MDSYRPTREFVFRIVVQWVDTESVSMDLIGLCFGVNKYKAKTTSLLMGPLITRSFRANLRITRGIYVGIIPEAINVFTGIV